MKSSLLLIPVFCLLWVQTSFAQVSNPIVGLDQWRIHLPYNEGKFVSGGSDLVYCATRYALFSYKKSDGSVQRYSRLTGLADFEITTIRYNPEDHLLLIAYQNSNVDLLYDDGTVINLPDIKLKNIVGGKSINSILFFNHNAYLSCQFGIVVLDLVKHEVKDTYYIGNGGAAVDVHQLAYDGSKFYAATETGIYYADASSPTLFNYEVWNNDTSMYLLANPHKAFTGIVVYQGKIITVYQDTLKLISDGTAWTDFTPFDHFSGSVLDVYNNLLMRQNYFSITILDEMFNTIALFNNDQYANAVPQYVYRDPDGTFWIADNKNGLVKCVNYNFENIYLNSPSGIGAWAMAAGKQGIWVAGGSLQGTTCPPEATFGSYWFNSNTWKSFNTQNDPIYNSLYSKCTISVAVDQNDGKKAYVGTRSSGLLEYGENGIVKVYDKNNSTIQDIDGDPGATWIGGIDFDNDGNLWVLSNINSAQLSERTTGGVWKSFNLGAAYNGYYIYNMIVDSYNQKWINAKGAGVIVFNENDPDNPNDNQVTLLTTTPGKGGLPTNDIYSMVEDKDQAIWIGSSAGVFVIYNPGNIFSGGNYDAQKVLIEQDGHVQYLLETEVVTSIAVDGANRKWFGTESSGIYLMSADATKLIHSFNVDNSPLPSNSIKSIAIDPVSGEVFIGTADKGICSYRADATEGGEICDNHYVFPNPVKHEYHGPIAISGLVANASVKIADVSGQVVFQTKANGGEAVWNGNNFKGERAHTGVYMVYVTNEDGSQTCVSKMLFTN
ncbi:two-component regulator propeller domain-containing protein [soil metagenome]